MHLVSPSLPTGAFSYSQGLEWAVEAGWVHDGPSLASWLDNLMENSIGFTDIPILRRMFQACELENLEEFDHWCDVLLAFRETSELRQEEQNRGRALSRLLHSLNIPLASLWRESLDRSQLAGYALAATTWEIGLEESCLGYGWAWLENQVLAGVKIIPLGQTEGQQILLKLSHCITNVIEEGLALDDDNIGASSPAFSLASSLHETQYTRLYRS